ncbi:MAG TPA: aldehyde dehydrogenase family protein [Polyangiaceae bacterium]|jgi:acyl-CoA reductase-like NAD-dependent aldehyde dehydrogenase|nr:aldehyde dehydrogenase family protein [Polyangiaceae bacterium]
MTFSTTSPLDGTALDPIEPTETSAIQAIVADARNAQPEWAAKSPAERIEAITKVKDRVLDRAELIAKTLKSELGKPETESLLAEVLPSGDVVDFWCKSIEELLEEQEVELDALAYPGKRGAIRREPRGVIGVIMPWNFPIALPLRTIIPALLAGNAVVFKPSEVSPRAGKIIGDLFDGVVPKGVFTVVQGGRDAGAALCEADVDLVVFTGSVAAGKKVAHACAERLIPCSLELGGKDAAIVLADANLERAANGVVWGAMSNAGQNCAAIERVYVDKSIADAFSKKVAEITKSLKFGDDIGPLATEAQRETVKKHVDGADGEILAGGKSLDKGYGYEPTVLKVKSDDVPLMQDETFGPVLPIHVVSGEDEAVKLANDSKYGLTASVWTKDIEKGKRVAMRLRAGVVTVNNHAFTGALPQAPWSGFGETGYGITNSPLALDAMTRPRFVLVDSNRAKRELWWYPYTPALRMVALSFAKLRSGGTPIGEKIRAVFSLVSAFIARMRE